MPIYHTVNLGVGLTTSHLIYYDHPNGPFERNNKHFNLVSSALQL